MCSGCVRTARLTGASLYAVNTCPHFQHYLVTLGDRFTRPILLTHVDTSKKVVSVYLLVDISTKLVD